MYISKVTFSIFVLYGALIYYAFLRNIKNTTHAAERLHGLDFCARSKLEKICLCFILRNCYFDYGLCKDDFSLY